MSICTSLKTDGSPCSNRVVRGEQTCFAHSERGREQRELATVASAEARRNRVEAREKAFEEDLLTLTQRIRREAAEHSQEIAEALVEAAIADGSSRAMAELLNRVEGKVTESLVINPNDPFQMDEAQLHKWLSDNSPEYGPADEDH